MGILFVGNMPWDFGFSPGTYNTSVTSGRDTAYSRNSLQLRVGDQGNIILPSYTGDFWLHFRLFCSSFNNSSSVTSGFVIYDAAGNALAELRRLTGASQAHRIRVYGDTTVDGAGSLNFANNQTYTVDIKLSVTSATVQADLYINGALVSTASAANTVGGKGLASRVSLLNNIAATANFLYISEVICADNESTVGMRASQRTVNAAGTYSDWAGSVSNLGDEGMETVVVSDAPNEKISFTLTAYGGPASPTSIRAVVVNTAARRVSGTPSQIGHFVRIGSTDYEETPTPVGIGQVVRDVFDQNPATSASWTVSDLSSVEIGLKSAA